MPVASPRASLRALRTVPLEWNDENLLSLAKAIQQLQERFRTIPVEVVSVTADYTALDVDALVLADASGGGITVTLPTAAGVEGRLVEVKKTDSSSNTVVIDGDGAETIDGSTTVTLRNENDMRSMRSDGTNWQIVGAMGNLDAL